MLNFLAPRDQDFDFEVKSLPEGNYLFYTHLHGVPGLLVRSALVIRMQGTKKWFTRVTRISKSTDFSNPGATGRHKGQVFANETDIYLLGRNRHSPRQLSFVSFEMSQELNEIYYSGLAVTKSIGGSTALKCFAVLQNPNTTIRQLLSLVGPIHESDPTIDHIVVSALSS